VSATARALARLRANPQLTPRHLRLVRVERASRRFGVRTGVVIGVFVVVGMFAVVVCQAMLVQGQIRLDQLEADVAEAQATYQARRLEAAELESPERIVREATERIGMVTPEQVIYVTPDGPVDGMTSQPEGSEIAAADESWGHIKRYLEHTP
jgi:cell division protein FtsL